MAVNPFPVYWPNLPVTPERETKKRFPQQKEPGKCLRCNKPNEYQPGPYLCWECENVWPKEKK